MESDSDAAPPFQASAPIRFPSEFATAYSESRDRPEPIVRTEFPETWIWLSTEDLE